MRRPPGVIVSGLELEMLRRFGINDPAAFLRGGCVRWACDRCGDEFYTLPWDRDLDGVVRAEVAHVVIDHCAGTFIRGSVEPSRADLT